MNVFTPKQLAEKLKVSKETLRLWAETGKIKTTKTEGGHRRYIYNENKKDNEKNIKFIYARVSSKKQESDLKRQVEYLQKLYPNHKVITDIASGLNFRRRGLNKILEAVYTGTVAEIVVAYKDRLCRFGFELIENICKYFSTTLTIINNKDSESEKNELGEDLLSIITVFTARFYGKRKYSKDNRSRKQSTKKSRRWRGRSIIYNKKNSNISESITKNII